MDKTTLKKLRVEECPICEGGHFACPMHLLEAANSAPNIPGLMNSMITPPGTGVFGNHDHETMFDKLRELSQERN